MVHNYAPGRAQEHARALLGDYRGILQCDGYAAYKSLAHPGGKRGPRVLAFCWSHVRRGFYDLVKGGTAPIATEALTRIAALYRIEDDIRGLSPAEATPRARREAGCWYLSCALGSRRSCLPVAPQPTRSATP